MRMVRTGSRLLIYIIGVVALALLVPKVCRAFDTYTFNDGQELTVYGYLRNDTGLFVQNQPFQQNDNKLAAEITWFRTYLDWKINDKLKVFGDIQFAYAPHYPVEDGFAYPALDSSGQSRSDFYCQYNDINDVLREAYVEWSPDSADTIKIGRQIAIWGQSLTERVGDVVQPDDLRWSLAFANIQDTRIPEWMIREMHEFDSINTSLDLIVQPLLVDGPYTVNMVSQYANAVPGEPGQLFGFYPENRFLPPNSVGNLFLFPFSPGVAGPPFSRGWILVPHVGYVPTEIPTVAEKFPSGIADTRYGFRTSTMLDGYTFGVEYWHTQEYNPIFKRGGYTGKMIPTGQPGQYLPQRQYYLVYPTKDIFGAYFNKQCPWPGVVRAEAIWVPDQPFNTFDTSVSDAMVRRNYFKYMIAYDLDNYLYFRWHNTAPFNITIEQVGEYIPDSKDLQYLIYATKEPTFIPRFNGRISTNWLYNRWSTSITFSYWPWGNSGLIIPAIKWTPGWQNNRFSAKLEYIYVYGDSPYEGLGIFRTKSMILLETQLNF